MIQVLNAWLLTNIFVGWNAYAIGASAVLLLFLVFKLVKNRIKSMQKDLIRKVNQRTLEVSSQKEELQEQSEKLKKAYEEIKVKNIAIEEAFQHLTDSFGKLKDLNREKDGMIGIVAHDLRTPLNNIKGLSQLFEMSGELNEEQKGYLQKINQVVSQGNDLIIDILDVSAFESSERKLRKVNFGFKSFVNEWKSAYDQRLKDKDQKLVISDDWAEVELFSDKTKISRILDNILSNAIKFSPNGKSIYFDFKEFNNHVSISISDEGPGIKPEDRKEMFKPFSKLSAVPTGGESSNGLGLSIVKNLAAELGGDIVVNSEVGQGTEFKISIPK